MQGSNPQSVKKPIYSAPSDDNWRMLATVIIIQAIKDYRLALKKKNIDGKYGLNELEAFFSSEWCEALISMSTGMDYYYKKGEIKNRVDTMVKQKIKKKEEGKAS